VAEVLLFHHAHGLTAGCRSFAKRLRGAGHVVHTPDLFEGDRFADLDAGVAFAERVGFDVLLERGRRAADELPPGVVYAGFSLGVLPAQLLAQTRPGARGAVLAHSCVDPAAFGGPWPDELGVQIHMSEADPLSLPPNEDLDAARRLAATASRAQLVLYPGDRHLFADPGLPGFEPEAAARLTAHVLDFLRERDGAG
jgi:dienelactone hydrolase